MDQIDNKAYDINLPNGKVVILPSGKSMLLATDLSGCNAKFGKPDLFLTFTYNAKWREITESLHVVNNQFIAQPGFLN